MEVLCACGTRRAYRWATAEELAAVDSDFGLGPGSEAWGEGCVEDVVGVAGSCELNAKQYIPYVTLNILRTKDALYIYTCIRRNISQA